MHDVSHLAIAFATVIALTAFPASGETSGASPTGFTVTHRFETAASPRKIFDALREPARWWSSQHTWSGDARNLTLQADAGGCFCERWADNSVKHGEVIFATRDSVLRLRAALGPLQSLAAEGILTFALKDGGARTNVTVTYRVAGSPEAQLAALAEPVDRVIGEQVARLARYVDTGKPE
jgi:uncharacterized protein YndB with AHSA1/START domain